jgi:RecA/RadA recombinase
MAKQSKSTSASTPKTNTFDFSKISSVIDNLSKKSMIVVDNLKEEKSFISTGIYILNALISKSIKKGGVPKNRITIFAGPPQSGKSYIALNIARNAQKENYNIFYIDTEFAIENTDFDMFGIDIQNEDKFKLIRSNKVENLKIAVVQVLEALKEQKDKGVDVSNTLFILDSIGQLASAKEIEDAKEGKNKQDMSRAKAIKSLFRVITNDLGYLNIPLICTNHIYMTQDLFPQEKQSGGEGVNYSASVVVYLTIAKIEDKDKDELSLGSTGVVVTAKSRKNRLAKPKKIKFEIDHTKGCNPYKGLEFFCTVENFETVGIAQVKPVTNKTTGEVTYEAGAKGSKWYVKHLDKSFFDKQIYNGKVFNSDVIDALEPIIFDYFKYASFEEIQKINEELDEQYQEFEADDDLEIDSEGSDDYLMK